METIQYIAPTIRIRQINSFPPVVSQDRWIIEVLSESGDPDQDIEDEWASFYKTPTSFATAEEAEERARFHMQPAHELYADAVAAKRKPGRPRLHDEPREEVRAKLPVSLVAAIDAASDNRTAFVEQAVREKLAQSGEVGNQPD